MNEENLVNLNMDLGPTLWGIFWVVILILFIYLILRRAKIKNTENFGDRSN